MRYVFLSLLTSCLLILAAPALSPAASAEGPAVSKTFLIELLRLPHESVSSAWTYAQGDFDELRRGDLAAKTAARKQRLAALSPGDASVQAADLNYEIAVLLEYAGKKEAAVPHAVGALKLYRNLAAAKQPSARILYKLGLALYLDANNKDKGAAAAEAFQQALKTDPDFCVPYTELVLENGGGKDWLAGAEACFQRTIARPEAGGEDYFNYFQFRFSVAVKSTMAKPNQSDAESLQVLIDPVNVEILEKAVLRDPSLLKARGALAAMQVGLAYREWMYGLIAAMPQTDQLPGSTAFQTAVKAAKERAGESIAGAEKSLQAIDASARNIFPALYYLWGILKSIEGDLDGAERYFVRAIDRDPAEGYYEYLLTLYTIALPEGNARQAKYALLASMMKKKCAEKCTAKEHFLISKLAFEGKRYPEAEKYLRSALAINASYFQARAGLGVILIKQGKLEEAVAELQKARDLLSKVDAPEQAFFCSTAGVFNLLAGNIDEGKAWLGKALELDPGEPTAGKVLQELKRTSQK